MTRRTSRALFAVAALVVAGVGAAVVTTVATASSPGASSFVPITPCRLMDTRPGSDTVGTRATPIGAGETHTIETWGTNGNCTIPTSATGLSLNVVAITPTAGSFLTVFPSGVDRPVASSLNWVAGQAPTPNAVVSRLGSDGRLSFYNLTGTVNLAVDVVGYYEASGAGSAGPSGPAGPAGPAGPQGPGVDPERVIWVAESGGDFTTISAALASITDNSVMSPYLIRVAPGTYVENAGIDLKNWVDIEGSGDTTTIRSNGSGTAGATIRSDTNVRAEVSRLRVVSEGASVFDIYKSDLTLRDLELDVTATTNTTRVVDVDAATVTMENVNITASSAVFLGRVTGVYAAGGATVDLGRVSTSVEGSPSAANSCLGIDANGSTLDANDLDVTLDSCSASYGIGVMSGEASVADARVTLVPVPAALTRYVHLFDSSATLDGIAARGGTSGSVIYAFESQVTLRNSSIRGAGTGIFAPSSSFVVTGTLLELPPSIVSGPCVGVVDGSYAPISC